VLKCFVLFQFTADLEEMEAAFGAGADDECGRQLERNREEWENIPLNVAVIGNSGVGKSSFINAIRGLTADDEGAAEVGTTKNTMEIRSYEHPNNPMLKFCDLPGVGNDLFPRSTYLADIDVDRYDFFLLLTADRFTENDTWLGSELCSLSKKYFFVRTKMGVDISNNSEAHPTSHNEEAVIEFIRRDVTKHLRENGLEDVPVLLIDNYKLNKFDFSKLQVQLIKDFPQQKRTALIFSLQPTSVDMIGLKVAELRSRIWWRAAVSGAVGAVPILGASIAMNIGIITGEATFYFEQLGLDSKSSQRYAKLHSFDYVNIQSIICSGLRTELVGTVTEKVVGKIVKRIIRRSGSKLALSTVTRFIPLVGSVIGASASYTGTNSALNEILDKFEETAIDVLKFTADGVAKETDTSAETQSRSNGEVEDTLVRKSSRRCHS